MNWVLVKKSFRTAREIQFLSFSVRPQCALCHCGERIVGKFTTEAQKFTEVAQRLESIRQTRCLA